MKILVAEDDLVTLRLLQAHLTRWKFTPVVVQDGEQALRALEDPTGPRLAILDWIMPKLEGVAVCRKVRALTDPAYRYLMLLTSKDLKQHAAEGLDAGADDYLTKPFNPSELQARLRVGQRILNLHGELLATQEVLREQATRDALTGLWNRRAILEMLEREIARARRGQTPTAVIMGDLDHFKSINDTFGHAGGDEVLREIGRRISGSLREYDGVGRYGGEEILIVLPNCDAAGARAIAERVRTSIGDRSVDSGDGRGIRATISLGVAVCQRDGCDPKSLIQAADSALYRAKANGRNAVAMAGAFLSVAA